MTDNVERLRDYGSNPMVQSEYSMVPARELLESANEIERLRGLLRDVMEGLDDYWVTTPEGISWVLRCSDALE